MLSKEGDKKSIQMNEGVDGILNSQRCNSRERSANNRPESKTHQDDERKVGTKHVGEGDRSENRNR
jgi:hypothetical protein